MVYITRQRVAKAVQTVQDNVSGLGIFLILVTGTCVFMVGRACVMWWNDYQQRQDPTAAAMLIFMMGFVLAIVGGAVSLFRARKNR